MQNLVLILSLLVVASATTVGPWVVRRLNQAFKQPVDELPPFPIILRPYPGISLLYWSAGVMCIGFTALFAYLNPTLWDVILIVGIPCLIIAVIVFVAAVKYSARSITLEADRITYNTGGKQIVVRRSEVKSFEIVPGYLILEKSDKSSAKMSLYFRDIKYLKAVVQNWLTQRKVSYE